MNDNRHRSKPPASLAPRDLAALIDISAVQAFHTEADVRELAEIAVAEGFIAAHALPNFVPLLRSLVPPGGPTLVGGPVGFPSGGHTTRMKIAEASELAEGGAQELDMMINVGRLKSGDIGYVRSEIRAVVEAIAPVPLNVILELAHLTDEEIRTASAIVAESGAAFVKTGTGWTPSATTLERLKLIAVTVEGAVEIKAAGGIRSLDAIAEMLRLGVTRFGINTQVAVDLVRQCAALPGSRLDIAGTAD
ncbi:deoxyribose-phosphate aldolase [Sinorhizobium medicae]|uniref:deoxyribose-phosphate aldolase n=1 Tax=Sinorhizobium medicae TaxID=110321 RepID=UPI002AF6B286|nr:deoxyribose-phosphate aldolase [Sinorhizobium medicae]WQO44765.1 deoxyribose-phosphate aldolase [Sinorhizobium medicae]WQO72006.1 deoxyribose-phosphate aldolase [Sinorhizobium medicae]WQO91357.1 deoxyribose-phosphate aldolase [Sinorhizobium medicae]